MMITLNAYWLECLSRRAVGVRLSQVQQQQAPPLPLLELVLSSTALYSERGGNIKSTTFIVLGISSAIIYRTREI